MTKNSKAKKNRREFKGIVVSAKADKTIVVAVKRSRVHSKYLKRYTITKKYKVHDEKNQYQEGDEVSFVESRPFSKDKRWRVLYRNNKESK